MKKIVVVLGALCLITFTSTSCKDDATKRIDEKKIVEAAERDASSSKFPIMTFEEKEHDFGEIEARKSVETIFKYKNTGDAPLVITNIKASCGCTVPKDWSREPLPVGESAQFSVKFNGSGSNKISKTITVTANTEKGSEELKIKAFIKPE